jgi:hypothetical protein
MRIRRHVHQPEETGIDLASMLQMFDVMNLRGRARSAVKPGEFSTLSSFTRYAFAGEEG